MFYAFIRSIRIDDSLFIVVIIAIIMVESKHALKRITSTWRLFNVSLVLSVTDSFVFFFSSISPRDIRYALIFCCWFCFRIPDINVLSG